MKLRLSEEELGVGAEQTEDVGGERRRDHFVRVVRRQEQPNCTGEDGLLAVMVCDGIRRILDTESGMVDIPPVR